MTKHWKSDLISARAKKKSTDPLQLLSVSDEKSALEFGPFAAYYERLDQSVFGADPILGLNRRYYVSFKLIESVLNLVEGILKRGSHRHHKLTNLLCNYCTALTIDL